MSSRYDRSVDLPARYTVVQALPSATGAYRVRDRLDGGRLRFLKRSEPNSAHREFDVLASLVHPGLPRVLDTGVGRSADGPYRYFTAEWIEGASLESALLATGGQPASLVRALGDAIEALAFLHRSGLRHGDVKPANILVSPTGGTLVDLSCVAPLDETSSTLSGTRGFLAPEQLDRGVADARSDLFALGRTIEAVGTQIAIPIHIRALASRLTRPDPSERPSMDEVLETFGRERAVFAAVGRRHALVDREQVLAALETRVDQGGLARLSGAVGVGKTAVLRELRLRAAPDREAILLDASSGLVEAVIEAVAALGWSNKRGLEAILEASGPDEVLFLLDNVSDSEAAFGKLREALRAQPRWAVVAAQRDSDPDAMSLSPLGDEAVRTLIPKSCPTDTVDAIVVAAEGIPAAVEACLAALQTGAPLPSQPTRPLPVNDAEWALLVDLALHISEPLSCDTVPLPASSAARSLLGRGSLQLVDGRARVRRAPDVETAASAPLLRARRRARVAELASESSVAARAARTMHETLLSGSAADLPEPEELRELPSRGWARLGEALVDVADAEVRRFAIGALLRAGRLERAANELSRETMPLRGASLLLAELRLLRGDGEDAVAAARVAGNEATSSAERLRAAELEARALVAAGNCREALDRIDALDLSAAAPELRASFDEAKGVALSYSGEPERARDALYRAAEVAAEPRVRGRRLAYAGIERFRAADADAAALHFREALRVAEEHGLDDQVATALVNLGAVAQQQGDYDTMFACHRRALGLATALGRSATVASLEFNVSNLLLGLGVQERAEAGLDRAEAAAASAGLDRLRVPIAIARAELLVRRGHEAEASAAFVAAIRDAEAAGQKREALEARIARHRLVEASFLTLDRRAVAGFLADARELEAEDLEIRAEILEAKLAAVTGDAALAARTLEASEVRAGKRGLPVLVIEVQEALAGVYRDLGAPELEAEVLGRAARHRQRMALGLPSELRSTILKGAGVRAEVEAPGVDYRRVLEINKRLNSQLSVDAVLDAALNAAVELTGAERGFVLLAGDELEVKTARNVDRERVGRSHLKFSRGIAEQVVREGEAVITTDARDDARFRDHQSVHAMRLTSVICVPIPSPSGVLGAIYLDNRFERGRFDDDALALLTAFADQVAIALRNAELHRVLEAKTHALEEKTRALEVEKVRVEGLLHEREAQLANLQASPPEESSEFEHDFSHLVVKSEPMRQLCRTLDRIMDSELSVLIGGESGVGKEVV
ncbi:MAG: GAF domain-containing protein, partial [Myxococcota bacterium]